VLELATRLPGRRPERVIVPAGEPGRYVVKDPHAGSQISYSSPADDLLDLNGAPDCLAAEDPQAAQFVKLRYFAGLSVTVAAQTPAAGGTAAGNVMSFRFSEQFHPDFPFAR
jgi:hypothetical protein